MSGGGFLGGFAGSMRDAPSTDGIAPQVDVDDVARGVGHTGAASSDGPLDDHGHEEHVAPARAVSAAAMAIADQIMGLDDAIVERQGRTAVTLRAADGALVEVEQECTIGRSEDENRITVSDGRVSRSHALVTHRAGRVSVQDLGSSNGTLLVRDGMFEQVTNEPRELRAGDRLETVGGVLLVEIVEVHL